MKPGKNIGVFAYKKRICFGAPSQDLEKTIILKQELENSPFDYPK